MTQDPEVPRRGYDTRDVEAMEQVLESPAESGSARNGAVVLLVSVVAIAAGAIWFLFLR